MSQKIKAIQTYGPRLVRGETVRKQELVSLLSSRTGYNSSELTGMLEELRDIILFYCRSGRGVLLDGLGTYLPYIKLDGTLIVSHRLDPHIRKSSAELVELWNEDHPDDPIVPN